LYLFNDDLKGFKNMASNDIIIKVEILRTYKPINIRQWIGYVVKIDGFRIPQKVMEVLVDVGPWGSPQVQEMLLFRVTPYIRSIYVAGRWQQKREKAGRR
jgi:hypothetical protein